MTRALAACLAAAGLAAPAAFAGRRPLLVGATDRYLPEPALAGSRHEAQRLRRAGMRAARLVVRWSRGERSLSQRRLAQIEHASRAAQERGLALYLAVYPSDASQVPRNAAERAVFAAWAASIARALPLVRNFIVGNEPNHDRYWLPQFGPNGSDAAAAGFERMLAAAYDALKGVSPRIFVWGCGCADHGNDTARGRPTHSPVRFLEDMGAVYRASGRTRPIMDGLAYHPYMPHFDTPPTFRYPPSSTTMTVADYKHLVGTLILAFHGTAQPGRTLPILYDEFGVQAAVPPSERKFYAGTTPPTVHRVDPATQARYYDAALRLASCEPHVRGLFVFPFEDDRSLRRWQSGLYYLNAAPRPSLATLRRDASEIRAGAFVRCAFIHTTKLATIFYHPRADNPGITITCDRDCTFRLRVVRAGSGVTAETYGRAPHGSIHTAALHVKLAPARYRFTLDIRPAHAPPERNHTRLFRVGPG